MNESKDATVACLRGFAKRFRQEQEKLLRDRELALADYDAKIGLLDSVWATLENEADRLERDSSRVGCPVPERAQEQCVPCAGTGAAVGVSPAEYRRLREAVEREET